MTGRSAGGPPAKRHDPINKVFLDLIRSQRILEEGSRLRAVIAEAIGRKSPFQYGGELTSRAGARRFVRSVAQLVRFVGTHMRSKACH